MAISPRPLHMLAARRARSNFVVLHCETVCFLGFAATGAVDSCASAILRTDSSIVGNGRSLSTVGNMSRAAGGALSRLMRVSGMGAARGAGVILAGLRHGK